MMRLVPRRILHLAHLTGYQQAFAAYQALPEDQQAALKKAFLDTTNPLVVKQNNDAVKKGKAAFSSPLVLSTFKVFLVEDQGF